MIGLRPALAVDAAAIARVHVAAWHLALDAVVPAAMKEAVDVATYQAMWESLLSQHAGAHTTIVATDDGAVIGFATAGIKTAATPGIDCELHTLYVSPDYQRRNVGRRLLHLIETVMAGAGCRSMAATVIDTPQARGFFLSSGAELAASNKLAVAEGPAPAMDIFIWRQLQPHLLETLI